MKSFTPDLPFVFLDLTGGVVQAEYSYPGTGTPFVVTLDLDDEGLDEDEARELADRLDAAMDAMEQKTDGHPDDVVAIAGYRQQAAELRQTSIPVSVEVTPRGQRMMERQLVEDER